MYVFHINVKYRGVRLNYLICNINNIRRCFNYKIYTTRLYLKDGWRLF